MNKIIIEWFSKELINIFKIIILEIGLVYMCEPNMGFWKS